ncbi:MAG: hypothetical protein Ta2B_29260 [Termitinemataceae bacterium]|nr:MAG: hypothetical protein Ta2B_29260 [Termitinemataceae bacterium]
MNKIYHFIVLVPHRDALVNLKKYLTGSTLFNSQSNIPFPNIAPIAITKEPVQMAYLKRLAKKLRTLYPNGKTICGNVILEKLYGTSQLDYFITGRKLLLDTNRLLDDTTDTTNVIKYKFTNVVLCAYIKRLSITVKEKMDIDFENELPDMQFSTCALANMVLRRINSNSFEWKIGRLFWLERSKN